MSTSPSHGEEEAATPALEWAGLSDCGLVRKNNEDAFAVTFIGDAGRASPRETEGRAAQVPARGCLAMVSDGVGGANAGEVASGIAVQTLPEALASVGFNPAGQSNRACGLRLEEAIRAANGRVRQEAAADQRRAGMAATLSVLWLLDGRAIIGQVGDSRIYRFRPGHLVQLTQDQSAVGRMVHTGQLTEAEAKAFRGRNIIDQSLGMGEQNFAPEIDWVEVLPGDLFLLCSDGLVDRLENRHLAEILEACREEGRSLAETVAELVAQSNRASGRDNTTAVLARVAAVPADTRTVRTDSVGQRPAALPARGRAGLLLAGMAGGLAVGAAGFWLFVHEPQVQLLRTRAAGESDRAVALGRALDDGERASSAALAEREARVQDLTTEIGRLEAQLAGAGAAAAEHQRRAGELQAQAAGLEARREEDAGQIARLEELLKAARAEAARLEEERDEALRRAETAEQAVAAASAAAVSDPNVAPAPGSP